MSTENKYTLGMIGLGTMGRNLLLNMADHGFNVAGYDKDQSKLTLLENEGTGKPVKAYTSLNDFVNSLDHPRVIMLLVPAGKIVDAVIDELQPLLAAGDIIIDGGNSHFNDTTARVNRLAEIGLHFFGMGISGGEEGARTGPSMMPGGDMEAYLFVKPILESIAAKVNGTGKWTIQISTVLELPIPTIDIAVAMRDLAKYKSLRTEAANAYKSDINFTDLNQNEFLVKLEDAFYFLMILIYAQGMHLLSKASVAY